MQSWLQDVPAAHFQQSPIRSVSAHKPYVLTLLQRPGVLLVGKNEMWASPICKVIERVGAEVVFIPPSRVTAECILHDAYMMVLLDSCVSSEQRRNLAANLLGSNVSLFYVYPVETGCWWLPALLFGEDCHGSPAFRAREFLNELDRILQSRVKP